MSTQANGEIRADSIYTLEKVKLITGLKDGALRAMRRAGLPVRYVAGRGFVSGKALADFIESMGKETK